MTIRPWMPLVAVLALSVGLAGCGNGDDEEASPEGGEGVEENAQLPQDEAGDEVEAPVGEAPPEDEDADPTMEDTTQTEPEAGQAAGGLSENDEDTTPQEEVEEGGEPTPEEVIGESPSSIDEETAMPGETTGSDIEEFMQETERRFEEAQKELDQQYEEIESRDPAADDIDIEELENRETATPQEE